MAISQAVGVVEAWYLDRALPPLFKVVETLDGAPELIACLKALGYRPRTETLTMAGPTALSSGSDVQISEALSDDFIRVFSALGSDPADTQERLDALVRAPKPRAFACLAADGVPAAIGACAIEGEFAGVFAMRTHPGHRRKGLARQVLRALLAWARAGGANQAYLQVEANNLPAVELYAQTGFMEAYRYRYWSRCSVRP